MYIFVEIKFIYSNKYNQKKGFDVKMKLTENGEILAENKVLILYILNKLNEPISNDGLLRLVLSVMDMNYFYFQQFLLDLQEHNYIDSFVKGGKSLYKITDSGKETLSLLNDILPGIMKLKVDTNFKNELTNAAEKESITADFTPRSENDDYIVTCKINEKSETIFELKLYTSTRDEAKKIVDNWNENAYKIYPNVLNLLNNP